MNPNLIKTGSSSIVLGYNHYKYFIPKKKNKLLKIVKNTDHHNEFRNLYLIKQIKNYENYYSIPEEISYLLDPSNDFYNYIKDVVKNDTMTIFTSPLECYYIDFAGDRDILDTLSDLIMFNDNSVWKSYKSILHFTKQIAEALNFLHKIKICHLDIKPENIMVNTYKKQFKLIDFGFSSQEPFDDFIQYPKGTTGYIPKLIKDDKVTEWLPQINANDMILINGKTPYMTDKKLVYKIDSYCFGRVLYYIRYIYEDNMTLSCFCEKKSRCKVNNIINTLIEDNVYKRLTITQCINLYFN